MKIGSIIEKKSKQAKASAKKPKLVKPNLGHESPHPMQGKLVGESPNFSKGSDLDKMEMPDKLIAQDLYDLMKQIGPEKFIGFLFSAMTNPKFKTLSLEKFADEIKNVYTQTRTPGAFDSQTNQSSISYGARGLGLNKDGELDFKETKSKKSNPVAKHSKNMPGAGAHKSPKDYDRKDSKKEIQKQLDEAPYSGDKSTLLSAVLSDIKSKALDEEGISFLKQAARLVGKKIYKRDNGALTMESPIAFTECPKCRGSIVHESQLDEKQDACYHKVKSRYKVWPSAYASGALVKCRKVGAKNWGNSSKKKKKKSKK